MASNSNTTSIRGKDWLLNAIWSSCGDPSAPRCVINMPLTFLFMDGEPIKALVTNDRDEEGQGGEVVRVGFEGHDLDRDMREGVSFRGEGFRNLRIMRKLLLEYMDKNEYIVLQNYQTRKTSHNLPQMNKNLSGSPDSKLAAGGNTNFEDDGEPYVATVVYADGEKEDLSLRTLDILMRNDMWRPQILILQAYVPSMSSQKGKYDSKKEGDTKVRSLLESTGAEAADKLTKALAKYAERAYKASGGKVLGVTPSKSKYTGLELDVKLTVCEMTCAFALDPRDKVLFLYSDYTRVDLDTAQNQREAEKFMKDEKHGRETTAAQSVLVELKALLLHANKRGIQESFEHFDQSRSGFVDTDMMVDGLARLGIGTTYQVAEAMLHSMGGIGCNFLQAKDMDTFLRDQRSNDFSGSQSDMRSMRSTGGSAVTGFTGMNTKGDKGSPINKKKKLGNISRGGRGDDGNYSVSTMGGSPGGIIRGGDSPSTSSSFSMLYPPQKNTLEPINKNFNHTDSYAAETNADDANSYGGTYSSFDQLSDSQNQKWDYTALYQEADIKARKADALHGKEVVGPPSKHHTPLKIGRHHVGAGGSMRAKTRNERKENENDQNDQNDQNDGYFESQTGHSHTGHSAKRIQEDFESAANSAYLNAESTFDGSELPAPSDNYRIHPHEIEAPATLSKHSSKRNQRALKELRKGHDKWIKKKVTAPGTQASWTEAAIENDIATGGGISAGAGGEGANPNAAKDFIEAQAYPNLNHSNTTQDNRALSRGSSRGNSRGGGGGGGRGSKRKQAEDDAKKKEKDENDLNLTTIVREMNSRLNRSPDELCHIDNGCIMTYRVIKGEGLKVIDTGEENTEGIRDRSTYKKKTKRMEDLGMIDKDISRDRGTGFGSGSGTELGQAAGSGPSGESKRKEGVDSSDEEKDEKDPRDVDRWVAFTLVLIPDLFMSLDTLQKHFQILLTKYPHSRIILAGLPGLPNTIWPEGWVLNSDLHARSIAKLMQFLKQKKKLSPMEGEPVYFMGFGTGVMSLSRFVTMYMPGLPWLEPTFRAVILVNGLLKINKAFKNVCKDLRQSLMNAGAHEVNEMITSLMFHDEYIYQDGDTEIRNKILRAFWESRRTLMSEGSHMEDPTKSGLAYKGVLELLKGILTSTDNFDGAQMLSNCTVPVRV